MQVAYNMELLNPGNAWEYNGPWDSDWYTILYLPETQSFKRVETGTTRCANGLHFDLSKSYDLREWTDAAKAEALAVLTAMYYRSLRATADKKVLEPDSIEVGNRVRLSVDHRNKATEQTPCDRCGGSGKWTNPNRADDTRPCFGCGGTGSTSVKVKGPMVKLAAGLTGVVVWQGTFTTIWRNGYNKLNRFTISTRVRLDDGRVVSVPLEKLRLDLEPESDAEVHRRAEYYAETFNVYPFYPSAFVSMM